MIRVATDVFEVVWADRSVTRFDTLDEARTARNEAGSGQVRSRVVHADVPAEYAVRTSLPGGGTVEHGRSAVPATAATLSRQHPGSRVVMVAAAPPDVSPPV